MLFSKEGERVNEQIKRLQMCGYRLDDAWAIVNDFLRMLDFDALKAFIEAQELVQRYGRL